MKNDIAYKVSELDNYINILLSQIDNADYPYTESEIRAIMHQIDRLTIKKDIYQDRLNYASDVHKNSKNRNIRVIIILISYIFMIVLDIIIDLIV